ncbi:NADPH-dependent glutamate synthase beta chain [Desulfonispora thiosulfatigenes DSM 11270]|uniref:NADPH-dependent glutamate synthase beta chain n=1 Tax=Desulfonispora thiosulfatigenes DSM 11270 TaxID=656914 RepID=A0A1W1VDJ6_DESTI|nr:FAD-dependent oxidoreductase [Desulfonispora thiosulfatigenes]SMB91280.1 NADPH-dependent glutamate synthase beta chain [Desulfonispora thiosulfatigenes DSM 11270]
MAEVIKMKNNKQGSVMVVGAGIAGIQSSLDLAEMGYKVYLVEKSPAIGGTMPALDKTFPTNDCSMCILSPKLVECGRHLNIEILTNSEVEEVSGEVGNFKVKVKKEPRFIDTDKCTGCGDCATACPVEINNEFEKNLSKSKATYKKYAQAFPNAFAIMKDGTAPCKGTCPANVNAQGYIALTKAGKLKEAASIVYDDLLMPGALGRICPHPCENECSRAQAESALSIAGIKRFLADNHKRPALNISEFKDEKIAIIGAGPAGLTCAFELLKKGYKSTVFEALPVAGGMLAVGIPDYRLPRETLDKEISFLTENGVEIKYNTKLGQDITVEGLKAEGYKAVFIATGAHKNRPLDIAGEEFVLSGVDFLRKVNLGEKVGLGKKVGIVGGGDVAMDAARSALRLGAQEVTIYYRRSRAELPARLEEIEGAEDEGIKFKYLAAPIIAVEEQGKLQGAVFVEMELGQPDESGRRRPVMKPDSEYYEKLDTIIAAVGQKASIDGLPEELELTSWKTVIGDEITLATSLDGVFVGGEVRTGSGIAIEAINEGKKASESIIRYIKEKDLAEGRDEKPKVAAKPPVDKDLVRLERVNHNELPVDERITNFEEVALPFSEEDILRESNRCMDCGPCSECMECVKVCKAECIDHTQKREYIDLNVGAVLLEPGFTEFPAEDISSYGFGRYKNVVTSAQFERILSASGPFGGHLIRPSDHKEPKRIAWIQCVGSRNERENKSYCSGVCCMYAIKEAVIAKEHSEDPLDTSIFYMDMRTHGKDFEKYYERAKKQGVNFIRSRIYEVDEKEDGSMVIRYATDDGRLMVEEYDLVVLSVGLCAPTGSEQIMNVMQIENNKYGFANTPVLEPIKTSRDGIFVAGAFSGPKDIPETVTQASAAAIEAAKSLMEVKNTLVKEKVYPEEIDVIGQKARIGVFICHCGINISSVVNIKEVVEYVKDLENVVFITDNMYTCSQDSQLKMKEIIEEHNLNRVVVASCSPRTHEPLFQETLKEAGLNPYLFDMANIRDQCSWVHRDNPVAATEKAKDLVAMAIGKARRLEPVHTTSLPIHAQGLVIGGGVSGMTAALSIASQGYSVHLVEKTGELGGNANHIGFNYQGEPVSEYVQTLKEEIMNSPLIHVYLNEKIADLKGFIGNFETSLASGKNISHGIVVLATGAKEYTPTEYAYGQDKNIMTYRQLKEAVMTNPESLKEMKNLVLINCVGSRNTEHPYCSKICCNQAVQLSLKAKEINPDINVFVLYRDMRTYGYNESFYTEARRKGVIFIRYEQDQAPEVVTTPQGIQVKVRDITLDQELLIPADTIGLAAATVADMENLELAKFLKVPMNEDGFFLEAHMKLRPVDFSTDGVFLCGLAHSPKPMAESIIQGKAAAARACTVLNRKEITAGGLTAHVNISICSACGTCVSICPAKAVEIDPEKNVAKVNEALCKGCGACAASCRSHSIDVKGFKSSQIVAMLDEICNVG